MSTLKITVDQWQRIRAELTVREHQEWVEVKEEFYKEPDWLNPGQEGFYKNKRQEHSIRLDFYNERKYTMFMLKFSEYLQ